MINLLVHVERAWLISERGIEEINEVRCEPPYRMFLAAPYVLAEKEDGKTTLRMPHESTGYGHRQVLYDLADKFEDLMYKMGSR